MGLFDVHAHLTDHRLAAIESTVLSNARAAGVTTILSNGLNPRDNEATAAVAARSDGLVRPCFGFYPVDMVLPEMLAAGVEYTRDDTHEPASSEEGVAWVREHIHECVAVGEIGLDWYWVPEEFRAKQEAVFRELVELAMLFDKPIIIHSRKAEARCFEVLKEMGATRVDWHCFGSKVKLAQRIAEHGHWLSIPANVNKDQGFQRMVEKLPRERLLLETDCPYLGPVRGELNEPANVRGTMQHMARVWGLDEDAVQAQLEGNFEALFGFAP